MNFMRCDHCERLSDSIYTFPIKFEGEPRIGGPSLCWNGSHTLMDPAPRINTLHLCRTCADKFITFVEPFLADKPEPIIELPHHIQKRISHLFSKLASQEHRAALKGISASMATSISELAEAAVSALDQLEDEAKSD